ncbi:MAG: XdhC/CoxI family protein [Calditrichaeota bacterium]|nr:MAG: XdhC/CoxI family protein [Calditrichota bacterium]
MKSLFTKALELLESRQSFVIATVVRTKGSTPQKPGARMIITAEDTTFGTLGGGCVEGDIFYLARQLLKDGKPHLYRKYTLTEEMAARDGLVCGGTMYFFLENIQDRERYEPLFQRICNALEGRDTFALALYLNPAHLAGQWIVIEDDGTLSAPHGDEAIDSQLQHIGLRMMMQGENTFLSFPNDVEIFLEGFSAPPQLVLLGGGHVGKAVSELAARVGFRIVVIDDREEYANCQRFPEAEETIVADFSEGLRKVNLSPNSFVLIATRGHRFDDLATRAAIETSARYIGLLGSKRKIVMIYRNLLQEGVSEKELQRIHAPVGLDIGALSPEEIAISIVGELIAVRRGKTGGFMKLAPEQILSLEKKSFLRPDTFSKKG